MFSENDFLTRIFLIKILISEIFYKNSENFWLEYIIATSIGVAKWRGRVLIPNPTLTLTLTPP